MVWRRYRQVFAQVFLAAALENVLFEIRRHRAIRHAVYKTDGRRSINMANVDHVSYDSRVADAWLAALPAFLETACLVAPVLLTAIKAVRHDENSEGADARDARACRLMSQTMCCQVSMPLRGWPVLVRDQVGDDGIPFGPIGDIELCYLANVYFLNLAGS